MILGIRVTLPAFVVVLLVSLLVAASGALAVEDTQAPILTDHGPSGAAAGTVFYNYAFISVAFTEPAPSGGYGTASISINGGAPQSCNVTTYWWPALDGWISCSVTDLPSGPIDYTVTMADNAGNTASVSGHFNVDPMQINISDDATGGDCGRIGSWDAGSRTCTMDRDLDWKMIEIMGDGITLDGNGHTMYGYRADVAAPPDQSQNLSPAVRVVQHTGVTVKNLTMAYYQTGLLLAESNNNHLINNTVYGTGVIDLYAGQGGEGGSGNWGNGILTTYSSNNEISGNSLNGSLFLPGEAYNNVTGIYVTDGFGNDLNHNQISGFAWGIGLFQGCGNSVSENLVQNNSSFGLILTGNDSCQGVETDTIWHNRFLDNSIQIFSYRLAAFNLPAPIGGNYFSDWNSPDADGDGFVDQPYIFETGQDNLPLARANTQGCGRPALTMGSPRPFWASYADYLSRDVTVSFLVRNQGGTFASAVRLESNSNTNGVATLTALPRTVGSVAPGAMVSTDLRYHIPDGITSWETSFTATAQDDCGSTFTYP